MTETSRADLVASASPSTATRSPFISAASFSSGNATRDADVISPALLDAPGFPEITFAGQGARQDGTDWVVAGSVTAHGTPGPAEVRVSGARVEGETVRFAATARLDRTSFGVIKKKGMVGRTVTVRIDAVGQPA